MNAPLETRPAGQPRPLRRVHLRRCAPDVLRPVIIEMGWQPEKCNKGGLRNAVQSLSISASPTILMVDLSKAATR